MFEFEKNIEPFCNISRVPATFFNIHGDIEWECLANEKICGFLNDCKDHQDICRKTFFSATKMAAQLGEPYVFLCPSRFIKIAMALFNDDEIKGFFIAGPISMGNNKENVIKNLFRNVHIPPDVCTNLTLYLSDIKIFSPKDVAYLTSLFNSTILASIITNEDYRKITSTLCYYGEIIEE